MKTIYLLPAFCLALTSFCRGDDVQPQAVVETTSAVTSEPQVATPQRPESQPTPETDSKATQSQPIPQLVWESDFDLAIEKAKSEKKMLLLLISKPESAATIEQLTHWLEAPEHRTKLDADYVCARLDSTVVVNYQDKEKPILEHPAFYEMGRRAGIAILDFQNDAYLGQTVGAFPLIAIRYTLFHVYHIINLPAGTLTQRMLTFAVRIHPNRPRSANGAPSTLLMRLAQGHANNQATTYNMGHSNFSYRSSCVMRAFPGTHSSEICAQSGSGVALVGALQLTQLWRNSSGHWPAMYSSSRAWGYDMKRARNGSWYGCGLFAK